MKKYTKLIVYMLTMLVIFFGYEQRVLAAEKLADIAEKQFIPQGAGAKSRPVAKKLQEWASITDYGADATGAMDSTAAIQAAIDANSRVYIPEGQYLVDPVVGIVVRTGLHLTGAGKNKAILVAKTGGGTLEQLRNYMQGSMIHRQFRVSSGKNAYVNEVYMADFSVVLNHPTDKVTTTEIQIGIDLRNITRSVIERVHVGNAAPVGGVYAKANPSAYGIQGYGIVVGNVSSSSSSYAGGEVNTIRDVSVWNAFKLVTIDDATLSPSSAAHGTKVINSDLQGGHHILVQESRHATGDTFRDNVLQNVKKQPGDATNAYVMRIEGYNNEMTGGYIEAGEKANYILYLGAQSRNNHIRLSYYSAKNAALIKDAGVKNEVEYFENSGSVAGGVDSFGQPVKLYDGAFKREWVKFHWDGANVVVDGGQGATVVRNAPGDYTITWALGFRTMNYAMSVLLDTNSSGNPGSVAVRSHTAKNVRITTFAQNGGATLSIDPRYVWVQAEQ